MQGYLTSILLTVFICGIICAICPKGKSSKTLSFAMSLCVLFVICSPLKNSHILKDIIRFDDITKAEESGSSDESDYLKNEISVLTESSLRRHISEKYGIDDEDMELSADCDVIDNSVIISDVHINLKGKGAAADIPSIVNYIKSTFGAECEVKINGK